MFQMIIHHQRNYRNKNRKQRKEKNMERLLYLGGIICILYYLRIISYAGIGAAFSPIWLVIGSVFVGSGLLIRFQIIQKLHLPIGIKGIFLGIFLIGIVCFIAIEGILIYYGNAKPAQDADYMIVLGAKVNGSIPSKTLRARVLGTVSYLKENKHTKVIVSGGQGRGESVTEAFAMKELLLQQGISEDRIIMEDRSVNTEQNIRFSKGLIEEQSKKDIGQLKLIIATSDFHTFRGISLAKKQGFQQVSGCPAKPDKILTVHYYLREFFAVVKDKLMNHI